MPMEDEENINLITFPTDCHFVPYNRPEPTSKTDGRIFVLKFSSSSERYHFWMQSKSQARDGDPSYFSPRDLKIASIVDTLLQGEEVNINQEIAPYRSNNQGDDDEPMEDVEGHGSSSEQHQGGSGGAGPGATGGDIREEGAGAREGGADGGRA